MQFSAQRVQANVRKATTDDLMDRVTVFRAGLEPAAVPIILEELRSRGVTPEAIVLHEGSRVGVLFYDNGIACQCIRCAKPAVAREWGWQRIFRKVPLYPRTFLLCTDHARPKVGDD